MIFPAATQSVAGIFWVTGVFAVVTVATMLAAVTLGQIGPERLKIPALARFGHLAAGAAMLGCGVAIGGMGALIMADYSVIDAVCNIWTPEALSHRPGWTDEFFVGKVKGKHDSAGITLETMIEGMDEAGIDVAFLVAAKAGRVGLPGCYHMPLEVVSRAVEQYPDRFRGMLGLDPYMGMDGVRQLETAVRDFGFIGAHLYPHWFELPPNNAKYYPFYAKCIELDIPVQMQVGQSLIYAKEHPAVR